MGAQGKSGDGGLTRRAMQTSEASFAAVWNNPENDVFMSDYWTPFLEMCDASRMASARASPATLPVIIVPSCQPTFRVSTRGQNPQAQGQFFRSSGAHPGQTIA